ncbi:FecR domain-containing protein [Myxococcus landrumensis]|uniref:FecR domain-containing protein n=1 Tax=Myxococcus landrumensis TaxID=2813577 RepID=A0ABX7NB27_9BACT|nr:FecR domain-containing protein [Myxococcus landrumus]QSQ15696.1 FecR domain-containing protein [Myxococcus landrumus]
MAPRDFRAELRREDSQRREQGMPAGVKTRLGARLREARESKPAAWHRRLVFRGLAGAAVALALGVFFLRAPSPRTLGGLEVARASADLSVREEAAGVEIQGGEAALRDVARGITLENQGPLVVRGEPSGVRLVRGRAEFSVNRRQPGAPAAVVLVSGGAIEVMGTRFTVEERGTGGAVTLHEGAIAFRRLDGEVVQVRVGQTLVWPVEAPSEPAVPAPAPPEPERPQSLATPERKAGSSRAPPTPVRAPSVEDVLQELEVLRGRREFEQAARYLEESMRKQPVATRERLSFELGSLLTYQLKDSRRACAHWDLHEKQFRRGLYGESVQRARGTLSCERREVGR